jgi:translation initiation factor 2B subunit (eIF-2B alpha/beta/delta family)
MEEEGSTEYVHPLVEALREQAERIHTLEQQNSDLMKQEKILLNLLEISASTGDLMARSLKSLENIENQSKELSEAESCGVPQAFSDSDDLETID